jgi:FdhD protein
MNELPKRETPAGGTAERDADTAAPVARVVAGEAVGSAAPDRLAVELPVALTYNGAAHAVMMASPRDFGDFALGFSLSEGIIDAPAELLALAPRRESRGVTLAMTIPKARVAALEGRRRNLAGRTGCGICGVAEIAAALRPLPEMPATQAIAAAAVDRAVNALPDLQDGNLATGALHAAAFADATGAVRLLREDVGRHNALDKLIGATVAAGLDPAAGFVVVTSRASMEMVQKSASFGCPLLVAVSAPTSLAVELAEACGMTLAGFARGAGFNLYSHRERIAAP